MYIKDVSTNIIYEEQSLSCQDAETLPGGSEYAACLSPHFFSVLPPQPQLPDTKGRHQLQSKDFAFSRRKNQDFSSLLTVKTFFEEETGSISFLSPPKGHRLSVFI